MNCPLCGFEFEPDRSGCSTSCPFGSGCNLVCCPSCGYQGVDESRSRLASWAGRLFSLGRKPAAAPSPDSWGDGSRVSLSLIEPGVDATVVDLAGMPTARALRLGAFGLTPGAFVRIIQRTPVPVLRIGETDLGLEVGVLDQIHVIPGLHTALENTGGPDA